MNITYKKSAFKDLKSASNPKMKAKITEIVREIKTAESITQIKNSKKLQGYETAYRIRVGDFRIGIFVENNEVTLVRILNRNHIYKLFP